MKTLPKLVCVGLKKRWRSKNFQTAFAFVNTMITYKLASFFYRKKYFGKIETDSKCLLFLPKKWNLNTKCLFINWHVILQKLSSTTLNVAKLLTKFEVVFVVQSIFDVWPVPRLHLQQQCIWLLLKHKDSSTRVYRSLKQPIKVDDFHSMLRMSCVMRTYPSWVLQPLFECKCVTKQAYG